MLWVSASSHEVLRRRLECCLETSRPFKGGDIASSAGLWIVTVNCTRRVGYERRSCNEGEFLMLDDAIARTTRNDSDQLRVVLISDVRKLLLAQKKREVVRALAAASRTPLLT